ncbi:class I SAM-dependent DNA methyltransferase [Mycobacterium sp. 21AC1]|uniref:DNA methyltransferase n=1 Tax=[Mycobacterium] appelbergii TaxID=2939269 RepID=UPI002939334E|nr:DNA methyltransferase [Mycobacterium sp. 21AC1]MDV3125279.1 class I SAM-dependent DNA methyltransferase [Mycobacterium sp. 21AC1]
MPSYDSIVVGEDWISEHYFTTDSTKESFQGKVLELRKQWDAETAEGRDTVRRRLLGAAGELQTALSTLAENPDGAPAAHAMIRTVLGFPETLTDFTGERAGAELRLPNARPAGVTSTLLLQARPVESIDDLLDPETGLLLEAGQEDDKPIVSVTKAVSAAFRADDPPAFILVQVGQWVLLAEAQRWAEGRYLAVDLLVVTERRDDKRGGELDRAAAILGRQALLPDADGNIWWTGILEDSVKHTVGVSKDLREGIRLSIEIIANDVVRRRADRGLPLDEIDAQQLAKHSLRFLYRILFLLYAEASPEMRVLPSGAPEYGEGYGLDRLRELTLTELVSPTAKSGTHLYGSLAKLFRLVDRGHHPRTPVAGDGTDDPAPGLEFNALRADLFAPAATALIDQVGLSNDATQQVLQHLLLSKESKGRKGSDRGFISYAELGINQLGAVYEGLMSYTGFFAEEDLYEVAKNGDPEKGSWVVPMTRADHLSESDFVTTEDEATGERVPVIHRRGTFVFRLAGRERQQSASYYTPEVLTKFVVSQALEELLDQNGERTSPEQILQLTICEPALGSGAFAIEAVRQLAAEYLKRQQEDRREVIDADRYQVELQKVKAYLALHQVYGVDLNATAVELAEISLWLDTMVAGLQAPWFGLHLRRGNSLIGARRAVYAPTSLAKKAWLKEVPKDVPLGDEIGAGIHHFLLPAEGWGAVIGTPEAKTYAPDMREELRLWRNGIRANPSAAIKKRLAALAQRVETLWELTLRRLTIAESEIRRDIDVWGLHSHDRSSEAVTREQIEAVLQDENGAYRRLRRVMDAWCALWSWPLTTDIEPPDWDRWVGGLEAILGVPPKAGKFEKHGQISLAGDLSWQDLDVAEDNDRTFAQVLPIDNLLDRFPWLTVAAGIAEVQGFFHWELDFASVFVTGGFDLQVGNPPWVRPDWDEAGVLAEFDPWWQIGTRSMGGGEHQRRTDLLSRPDVCGIYLDERAGQAGMIEHYGSAIDRPALTGLRPNLYRCFMERTWRSASSRGIVTLIHPESHFTELRARGLRKEVYRRLRRHWQFRNEHKLFAEVKDTRQYGVFVYGRDRGIVKFVQASSLYHPATAILSMRHDGTGEVPGVRDNNDNWDMRPHRDRLVMVDESVLASWGAVIDEVGTPPIEARMLYLVNVPTSTIVNKIAQSPRLGITGYRWSYGWDEAAEKKRMNIRYKEAVPRGLTDVILQGPHISVAAPIFKQPRRDSLKKIDNEEIDLEKIDINFIPRTNYERCEEYDKYISTYTKWDGKFANEFYRLTWREMCDSATVRTLHATILPPGPTHVLTMHSIGGIPLDDVAIAAGVAASLIADFMMKISTSGHINVGAMGRLPHIRGHVLESQLKLRTLRLNCLTRPYATLWEEVYDQSWQRDSWVPHIGVDYPGREPLGHIGRNWEWATPLRRAAERRQALVEIDAIVAIMLGITSQEMLTMYRTQFPVLQKYEREALYDANGRQLPGKLASEYRKKGTLKPDDLTVDGVTYAEPFVRVGRERDMELAHKHFSQLAESGSGD